MNKLLILTSFATVLASHAHAEITVKDPWVRATVAQQKATGAFMRINTTVDTRLVKARSPVAGIVEIHEMKMENDIMRMRAVTGVDLPAGRSVDLKPGGYHVMLLDLKQQMKEGELVPVSLVFEGRDKKRETIEVKAQVRSLSGTSTKKDAHEGHKH